MRIYESANVNVANVKDIEAGGHIGDDVLINVRNLIIRTGGQINSGSKVVGGGDLEMESYSTIGYNVVVLTGVDVGWMRNDYAPPRLREVVRGVVTLGEGVAVGSGSIISISRESPNIVIGAHTVIMANSYVDRSLGPLIIYGRWGPNNMISRLRGVSP